MEKRRLMAEVTPQTPSYYLLSIICYLFLFPGADFVNILQKMSTSVNIYLYVSQHLSQKKRCGLWEDLSR